MKTYLVAAILLAALTGTAAAQERKVVQVIRLGDSMNYLQFDETGAMRGCKIGSGQVAGVPRLVCGAWVDPEDWPTSSPSSPSE